MKKAWGLQTNKLTNQPKPQLNTSSFKFFAADAGYGYFPSNLCSLTVEGIYGVSSLLFLLSLADENVTVQERKWESATCLEAPSLVGRASHWTGPLSMCRPRAGSWWCSCCACLPWEAATPWGTLSCGSHVWQEGVNWLGSYVTFTFFFLFVISLHLLKYLKFSFKKSHFQQPRLNAFNCFSSIKWETKRHPQKYVCKRKGQLSYKCCHIVI